MFRSIVAICCVTYASVGAARADGPYDGLLKYAPANANVIALIDAKGAYASPLAKKENWVEKGQANNRGGLGFLPSDTEKVVIACDINLNTMVRNFQVALVQLHNVPEMRDLAAREEGTLDSIADRASVLSPRDVYFTAVSASQLAAVYPADRQNTARWIRATKDSKSCPLCAYLKNAADKATDNTVTIAIDLEDVVDKHLLKASLTGSPTVVKNKDLDVGRLALFLSSIKGLTFKAKVDETVKASLTWNFAFDMTQFQKVLPSLAMELIDGQGIFIPGLDNWAVTFTDNSMTFSGSMTSGDLKRVISLFAFPAHNGDQGDAAANDNQISAGATKRYFAAVSSIVDDVAKFKDSPKYEKTATWHEKAAAQIEHLSRMRVDPVAVSESLRVASRLKSIGASLRGVPMNVNALENKSYYYYYTSPSYGVGWWGWRPVLGVGNNTQVDTNYPQIQAAISKVIDDDQKNRTEGWSLINRIMVETKMTLSDKYKIAF